MKIIDYIYDIENIEFVKESFDLMHNIDYEKVLYFDIETTGLSARNSTLYLIGVLAYDNNKIHLTQWFNDDGYSENDLITSFNEYCKDYTHIIHFNGLTFDIPYIREKASKQNIDINNIDQLIQIDIFKEIRSYKSLFGLDNMKLVTIEKYMGIERKDTCTGGELINVYQRYVARPDDEKEHLLLLHNHDDIIGLTKIINILNYKSLFDRPIVKSHSMSHDNSTLTIEVITDEHLYIPKRINLTNKNGIYINAFENKITLILPIIKDKFKHFFKDYKNYYYLPKEDMAIHKSVSAYVDSDNKERATKKNCYIAKDDTYIINHDTEYPETFFREYGDKLSYRTLNSLIDSSDDEQQKYIKNILQNFLKK